MTEEKKDAVATIPKGMEEFMTLDRPAGKDEGYLGTEGITRDDILMPRMAITQLTSKELIPTDERYIDGLKFGDLFNSVSKKIYGKGPLHFLILRRDEPRWMEFNPLDQGGGIKDRNVPKGDPRTAFGPKGEKPLATMFCDYIVLLLTDLNPADPIGNIIALSLKSSGVQAAKHLNLLITQRGEKLICKGIYEVITASKVDKKSQGSYSIYKFKNAGWLKEGSAFEKQVIELFESWKDREVRIDDDDTLPADPDAPGDAVEQPTAVADADVPF